MDAIIILSSLTIIVLGALGLAEAIRHRITHNYTTNYTTDYTRHYTSQCKRARKSNE
jgi:hypothetical protein